MNESTRIAAEEIGQVDTVQSEQPSRMTDMWARARRNRWFLLVVVLPTVVAAIYYSFIASDIYQSESSFVVRSPGQKQSSTSSLASLIQTTGLSAGQEETSEIMEYIRSRDPVAALDRTVGLRDRFARRGADFLVRYPGPMREDRFENLYRYYDDMVKVRLDNETGVAVLDVRAFTPDDARVINAGLLDLSEQLVNRLNFRAQHQAIAEDEQRVAKAEDRLRRARVALARYRNAQGLLDPEKQAAGVLSVSNQLVSEQAALQAQLDLMTKVAPDNPAIPSIRSRIGAIGKEIETQNGRAVGTDSGIASKLSSYENLSLVQQFATQMLTMANATLEQSRSDAQKQQFYLERIVEPNTPDLARYPGRIKRILTVAAVMLCLYFIGWMLVVGILEHAPEG